METKPSVSLCMIVKNEESCLEKCLMSMQGLVSEVVIVDTGSSDRTVEIAQKYHAVVKHYQWENDFAKARNYSLSFATQEWVLVLDADEYLRESDRALFQSVLCEKDVDSYYIKTLSFTEDNSPQSCVINLNHRLFRRNRGFYYKGAIHEQLLTNQTVNSQFSEIGFYHTGYLKEVVNAKKKPFRNKLILEEVLKAEPDNPFHQFNYANELVQLNRYEEAIYYYNKAYEATDYQKGYMPKLMIFRINTLLANKQSQEALAAADEGIKIYPHFTYLMFIKGTIEEQLGFPTRAIRSYEACLTLDKPGAQFEFASGAEGLWPHLKLATLYEYYGDYEMAIDHYKKYLLLDSSQYKIVYSIAACLRKMGVTDMELARELEVYLPQTHVSYQVLLIDVLMKEKCYELAQSYLEKSRPLERSSQLIYLYGKNQFYRGNYEECHKYFKQYIPFDSFQTVERYYYLMYLMTKQQDYDFVNLPYSSNYREINDHLEGADAAPLTNEGWGTLRLLLEELLMLPNEEYLDQVEGIVSPLLTLHQREELLQLYLKHQACNYVQKQLTLYLTQGGILNIAMIRLLNQRWQD
ncbi:MAG: glycosyltransferase [Turicibacter sp.]|nr:glycosyltransferase [Turicibacter sp.]